MENPAREQDFRQKTANGEFEKELENLLNRHGIDSNLNVHDFVLAEFLCDQLDALQNVQRELKRLRSPDSCVASGG